MSSGYARKLLNSLGVFVPKIALECLFQIILVQKNGIIRSSLMSETNHVIEIRFSLALYPKRNIKYQVFVCVLFVSMMKSKEA